MTLRVATGCPLESDVAIHIDEPGEETWALSIRQPAWAETAVVNGATRADERGYVNIHRTWNRDDKVRVPFPSAPRLSVSHPDVDALRGTVAIERGPIVYALKSADQPDLDLSHVETFADRPLTEEVREGFLGQRTIVIHAARAFTD